MSCVIYSKLCGSQNDELEVGQFAPILINLIVNNFCAKYN